MPSVVNLTGVNFCRRTRSGTTGSIRAQRRRERHLGIWVWRICFDGDSREALPIRRRSKSAADPVTSSHTVGHIGASELIQASKLAG
jgi:hypothetical protein